MRSLLKTFDVEDLYVLWGFTAGLSCVIFTFLVSAVVGQVYGDTWKIIDGDIAAGVAVVALVYLYMLVSDAVVIFREILDRARKEAEDGAAAG